MGTREDPHDVEGVEEVCNELGATRQTRCNEFFSHGRSSRAKN